MADPVEIAKKTRHLTLLQKVKGGRTLTASEIEELGRYEKKSDKPKKDTHQFKDGEIFETIAAASEYTGKTERTIRRWVADGMARTENGGYIKAVLDQWNRDNSGGGSGSLFEHKQRKDAADAEYREIKSKLAQIELAIAEGKYLPREEVERGRIERIDTVKRILLSLRMKLPPMLVHKGLADMKNIIGEEVERCIRIFAGQEDLTTEDTDKKN